jgi:hypothetical protein
LRGVLQFRLCVSKLPVQIVLNQPGKVVESILKKRSLMLRWQIAAPVN